MIYPQPRWVCIVLMSCFLLIVDAQQRPRTRLEIMIDDFVGDMSSFASRISTAFFADPSPRFPRPAPRPQQQLAGNINSFQVVPDISSNDIAFDSTNQIEEEHFPPNHRPQFNDQQEFVSRPHIDTKSQGSQDIQQQQILNPTQQLRPRIPPRPAAGFGIRQFVNRAMDRVRNMLPATRRRFTDPGFRVNNPHQQQQQAFQ